MDGRPDAQPPISATLDALRRWRDAGLARDPAAFAGIKDTHLQQLLQRVRSGGRTLAAISSAVPATIRPYAQEIAEILRREAEGGPAASSPSVTASTASIPAAPPPPAPQPDEEERGSSPHQAGGPSAGAAGNPPTPNGAPAAVELDPARFADFDFSEPAGEPGGLRHTAPGPAGMSLTWAAVADPAPVTIYRVVAGDDYPPYAPERADLIAVTRARKAVDHRPFTAAIRYVQVWRNEGDTVEDALAAQPRLHATASVVSPVTEFVVREDEGRVIGQWRVLDGVRRVQVYRVPIEKAAQAAGSPEHRIQASHDNLGGFVDASAERGRRYLYQAFAEAEVDGVARLSAPQNAQVSVSAVLAAVADLDVRLHGSDDDPQFDLSWTDPAAGRVAVFRTRTGPQAGADSGPRPESVLPQMHLAPEDRLSYPITRQDDGRVGMRDVPWPAHWTRTYFTPVTLLDGVARVGRTITATRIPPARDPALVERMNKQVLTFGWPDGAASVLVHVGPAGQDAASARGGRTYEISAAQYRDLGGLHLPEPLPAAGCSVHVVPVAFAGGERIEGDPVSVQYPGLLRISYRINARRGLLGRPTVLTVTVTSEVPVQSAPPFVLVHNPHRLPLDVTDGTAVEVRREGDETLTTTRRFVPTGLGPDAEPSVWRAELKEREGYVRLMADLPADVLARVAVLDPPVRQLILGGRG